MDLNMQREIGLVDPEEAEDEEDEDTPTPGVISSSGKVTFEKVPYDQATDWTKFGV